MIRRFKTFAFFVVSVALAALAASPAFAERRVALVLGNARYARISPLKNPINDAPDLAATLEKLGFEVILRMDARKSEFDRALAEFSRKSAAADVALFYYAGHGVQHQGKNYLLPTDIEVQDVADVKFQAVDMASVRQALDESGGVKILVLDSCRDNPFAKQLMATRSVAGGLTRGLARIDRTEGMIVAYATAPDQVAMDGGGRNSPFAEALITRLKEPGLEIGTMFRRVASDVYERTNRLQRPEVSSSLLNDFYLNPMENDRTAWERIRDSQDSGEFQKFIQHFPASPFSREAQYRLDLFERIRRENEERAKREARLAAEKAEAERKLAEQREAEKRETARLAAEKADAERKLAEQREAEKRETERLAAEKADAERKLAEQRETEKRETARLAQEKTDAERKEAERKKAEQIAAEKTEAERKRLAAIEEQERKGREAGLERKRIEAVCEREGGELKSIAAGQRTEALEDFRKRASCPSIGLAIDQTAELMRRATARTCDKDRRALAAAKPNDLAALRAAAANMSCDAVIADAQARIVKLEDAERRTQEACVAERRSVEAIDAVGFDAQQSYFALRARLDCGDARHDLEAALGRVEKRARQIQTELARLGCYSGAANGKFDETTKASMALYATRKGLDAAQARPTDDFVSELANQNLQVCPQQAPVATAPAAAPEKAPVQDARKEDENLSKAAKQRAQREEEAEETPAKRAKSPSRRASRDADVAPHGHIKSRHAKSERAPVQAARARPPAPAAPVTAASGSSQKMSVHGVGF